MPAFPQSRLPIRRRRWPPLPCVLRADEIRPPVHWLVHYGRFGKWETLLEVEPGSLRVRRIGGPAAPRPWVRRRLTLKRPHRVVALPGGRAVIADTDHDRLVILEHVAHGRIRVRRTIGGHRLRRPHDVLWSQADGYCYVVDSRSVCRFRPPFGAGEARLFTSRQLGYARALAWLDECVHIIASTRGTIIRFDDFTGRRLRTYCSPGKHSRASAGSWATTGLILNDVVRSGGWYYATNYFSPDYAGGGDAGPCRLIRWRSWTDFEQGRWEDLSSALAPDLVPYFFSTTNHGISVVVFCHGDHRRDAILQLDPTPLEKKARRT